MLRNIARRIYNHVGVRAREHMFSLRDLPEAPRALVNSEFPNAQNESWWVKWALNRFEWFNGGLFTVDELLKQFRGLASLG